ncbi:hypothetical protein [Pontibaca salina]|uniref:Excalibur calcium-binding domain-containing protein n=1 Tax=Pontibaca salina TaxID=2795731 RepID=A0A934M0M6_9RHOB|nr:hypothetical protein [Pontibaca salina]MBI6628811.1 hypothetical protein [Pontibaca salina]
MRAAICVFAMALAGACAPQTPNDAWWGGSADRARESELRGELAGANRLTRPAEVSQQSLDPATGAAYAPGPANSASDIAAQTAAALEASSDKDDGADEGPSHISPPNPIETGEPLSAMPDNSSPAAVNQFGISSENDFVAVSARQSIESDAERIARNRAQYQVVQPTELPPRPSEGRPNIVSYALSTTHAPGTKVYNRSPIKLGARSERRCAAYPSPDQAQIAFLAKGGPKRDRLGLDPDGDGFACGWDPSPFRNSVRN